MISWLCWIFWDKYKWNRLLKRWAKGHIRHLEANDCESGWVVWKDGKATMSIEQHEKLIGMMRKGYRRGYVIHLLNQSASDESRRTLNSNHA